LILTKTLDRGEGGNQAMQDSLNLARALAKSTSDNLLQNLKEYQDEMLERGGKATRASRAAALDSGSGTMSAWASWSGEETSKDS
jgi:2-polyprenyl-6-methoxyphenol hydroxylase-like FAD-dependent oxidoreductase